MKIQRTAVTETADGFRVELLFSDTPEPDPSQNSIAICAHLPIDIRYPRLVELQKATLQNARTAIDLEIHRLAQAEGRNP